MVFSPYHESWRNHPTLNNTYRHMFPGLKNAIAIFSCYLVLDWSYNRIAGSTGGGHGHEGESDYEGTRHEGAYQAKKREWFYKI